MRARSSCLLAFVPLLSAAPALAWGVSSSAATPPSGSVAPEPAAPEAPSTPEEAQPPAPPASADAPAPPAETLEPITLEEDAAGAPSAPPSPFVSPRAEPEPRKHERKRKHHAREVDLRESPERAEPAPVAPPDDDDQPPARRKREHWYGWQTLLVDGMALGLMLSGDKTAIGLGAVGYIFAPSVVHFGHGNVGIGFADMGIRAFLPLGGAVFGGFAYRCRSDRDDLECRDEAAGVGFLLGMAGAITLDAAVLAYDKPPKRGRRAEGVRLAPLVAAGRDGTQVGVQGSY